MTDWTPTTEQVRDCFSTDPEGEYRDPINAPSNKRWAEKAFDRWLADHDERVKAEAKAEQREADAQIAESDRDLEADGYYGQGRVEAAAAIRAAAKNGESK